MSLPSRLRGLDDRVLRDRTSPARDEWARRHGWSLFALLSLAFVGFGTRALSADRPAMAGLPLPLGVVLGAVAIYLFVKRDRR